ncbi:hypothetical protein XIS1_1020006 [Xenorhabdus innexi]|uniref:Uncharacterized protein n=1 Tax=Xenorhabdus innexi TaxID=290109 RepID=A0A1N6MQD6_9GAMM|nr:hypothetical protein XIS1_1020006 [Xenorhabdus innexi]
MNTTERAPKASRHEVLTAISMNLILGWDIGFKTKVICSQKQDSIQG